MLRCLGLATGPGNVIGGALNGIEQGFDLSTFLIEVITSWATLGALVGALVAGGLADKLGRRKTIILADVLFTAWERHAHEQGDTGLPSAMAGSA